MMNCQTVLQDCIIITVIYRYVVIQLIIVIKIVISSNHWNCLHYHFCSCFKPTFCIANREFIFCDHYDAK